MGYGFGCKFQAPKPYISPYPISFDRAWGSWDWGVSEKAWALTWAQSVKEALDSLGASRYYGPVEGSGFIGFYIGFRVVTVVVRAPHQDTGRAANDHNRTA